MPRFFERPICKRCQAFSVGDKKDAVSANMTSWGSHMPLSHRLLRGWSHISCTLNICASPKRKWDACAVLYNVWARFSIVLFIPSLGKETQRVACRKQKMKQNLTEEHSPSYHASILSLEPTPLPTVSSESRLLKQQPSYASRQQRCRARVNMLSLLYRNANRVSYRWDGADGDGGVLRRKTAVSEAPGPTSTHTLENGSFM